MDFEWDPTKSDLTAVRRGFGFDFAALIFRGPTVEWEDRRRDYGEVRMVSVGEAQGRLVTVVYCDRDDVRRIISAWPANRKERQKWSA